MVTPSTIYVIKRKIFLAELARQLGCNRVFGRKPLLISYKKSDVRSDAGNLFIKNLDHNVTRKELHNFFTKVGAVQSIKISSKPDGTNLGYGYVQFKNPEDAKKALEDLNGEKLGEKELSIQEFVKKNKRSDDSFENLYVRNFPTNASEQEVEKMITVASMSDIGPDAYRRKKFGAFGQIISKKVSKSKEGKWFGFVRFETHEQANKALKELNGKDLFGRPTILIFLY